MCVDFARSPWWGSELGLGLFAVPFPGLALAIDRSSGYNFRRLNCAQHSFRCDLTKRRLFRSYFLFYQDATLMAKERELKDAVKEGRDRVSAKQQLQNLII